MTVVICTTAVARRTGAAGRLWSGSLARVWRAVSRVWGEGPLVAISVSPSGNVAKIDDPGAETGHEHKKAGGSGQEEARAYVRAEVGADELFNDDFHVFIVIALRFVSYWGCPGANPENPEIVSGAVRAGEPS